ncbi:suppressor of cytokine signaling 1-like [Megalops cyprinoides]|uniref:suppressor of cytokine signaling 1-like n=1 Tax=Megalops cyprinoides TaxID=118141 RepID=UPI001863E473|nr:suppressor of cytokine signaling 1-like [Megalops cyprinoides]
MVAQSNVEGNAARHRTRAECPLDDPAPRRQRQPQDPQLPRSPEAPTHFRPFKSEKDFQIINATTSMLEHSGFYWGPMTVEEAHGKLSGEPLGTFLIRDSRQKDVFFTLSYRAESGPISIRINFQGSRFNLFGSKQSFDTLFKLLEYYIASPKRSLTRPYRRVKVQPLQELCRKRIMETCGGENIDSIPVNPVLKDFLNSFPYGL